MTKHDPLCPFSTGGGGMLARCQCHLIRQIRADERVLFDSLWRGALEQYRRDLRAKLVALHLDAQQRGDTYDMDDILALIDGGDGR